MRSLAILAAAGLLAGSAAAQTYHYVPGNTPSTGTCNVIPFGTTKPSSSWENQRYQTIVTNAQLGGGSVPIRICSLAFAPCGLQTHSADTLKITMAVTDATTLSTTFATNLATGAQVVLDTKDHVWPMTADAWNNIGLQDSYLYIPTRGKNLVVDMIITGNNRLAGSGLGFHRSNTEQRVYAVGWTGSPPATGSSGIAALKMRLGTDEGSIDNYGQGCGPGPLKIVASGTPVAPGPVVLGLTGGPVAGPGLLWLSFNNKLPYPINLDPPFTGCKLYCSIDIPIGVVFSGGSSNRIQIGIPRGLQCGQFFAQGLALDRTAPAGLVLSDYARVLIGL